MVPMGFNDVGDRRVEVNAFESLGALASTTVSTQSPLVVRHVLVFPFEFMEEVVDHSKMEFSKLTLQCSDTHMGGEDFANVIVKILATQV